MNNRGGIYSFVVNNLPMHKLFFFLFLIVCSSQAFTGSLPGLRKQSEIRQQWLKLRLERVLPHLMRKHKVDLWLIVCREYNEDPLFFSLVSPDVFAARRRTIYMFHDRGEQGVDRLALGGGSNGGLYTVYRDPAVENRELWGTGQWQLLRKLIEERNPSRIAVNISQTHSFADGLSSGEKEALEEALGQKWTSRFVRSEALAVEYISIRLPEMEPTYQQMMEIVHSLIRRAFSNEVIKPGETTNQDVVWWLRQEVNRQGMDVWFHPTVRVQRKDATGVRLLNEEDVSVIHRGDVLHTDFGIKAMGLTTDTQHMGYVLKEGETEPPAGIQTALKNANRLQDLLISRLRPGETGNKILDETLAAMKAAGIQGSVYTHPIGDHGHGAGPLIGLWDRQESIPGRGDLNVLSDMWFSIELSATTKVPEWNDQELWVGQEEDVIVKENGARWVLPRQTTYHLIH
jgi:Xaa-Pro aminopeptidase